MPRLFRACALALALAAPLMPARAAGVRVAPITVSIPADGGQATVWVTNSETQPWRAEARLYRWRQHEGRDVLEAATDVALSPRWLDIPADGHQLVRLVRTAAAPDHTENAYRLVVEERQDAQPDDQALMRYSAPVFALPVAALPELPELETRVVEEAGVAAVVIRNTGRQHARIADLSFHGIRGSQRVLYASLAGYILPGQEQRWPLPGPATSFASGYFSARVNSQAEERDLPRAEVR
jgi:fimbrial chaperone protein